jgi:flagellar assembly protein FliH
MALDKSILKSDIAAKSVFEYKPKEFSMDVSDAAVSYVHDEDARKSDFKISELAAQQSGVAKLEDERSQGIINEQVLEKLKDVQERAYKEAYDLGYQDGSEKAFQEEKAQLTDKLKKMDELISSLESMKRDLLMENEAQFIEITFLMAKKIALRDLSQNREAIVQLLGQVISDLQSEQKATLHVATADLETLEALQKRAEAPFESLKRMKIVADQEVEGGGCVIDLQYGKVDLTVADRIDRIWTVLEKQMHLNKKSS